MTAQPPPDLGALYRILVRTARNRMTVTYEDVSDAYESETGQWLHYHGTWDEPLGRINNTLHRQRPPLPAISAVVTLKPEEGQLIGMPGGGFWGCSPSVPERPRRPDQRLEVWSQILASVYEATFPDQLPEDAE